MICAQGLSLLHIKATFLLVMFYTLAISFGSSARAEHKCNCSRQNQAQKKSFHALILNWVNKLIKENQRNWAGRVSIIVDKTKIQSAYCIS